MAEQVLFVPECNVDTALALSLVSYRYTFVSHRQGIGQVARVLVAQQQAAFAGRRIIGIVDNDKKFRQAPELAGFTTVLLGGAEENEFPHCIRQHPARPNQYLILLNPACDSWLFRAAQEARVSLAALGLPAELPDFIDFCKQRDVEENTAMRNLLRAIQQARPNVYRELADFVATMMDVAPPRWP